MIDALTTDAVGLASLAALARTCRCAADRLREEQSIYRLAFVSRFGRRWSKRTPWRTALMSAVRALTLRTDPDTVADADSPFAHVGERYASEVLLAERILQSAFWRQICASAAMRQRWADRCLPHIATFFAARTIDPERPLWRAVLCVVGLFGAHLPVATPLRPEIMHYLLSFSGLTRFVTDPLGEAAARQCDASLCVFGVLLKLTSECAPESATCMRDSIVHIPLWPARGLVPTPLQPFVADVDADFAAALLNSYFGTFCGKYLYGEELQADPPMLGRLVFAPFARAAFDKQIEIEAAQFNGMQSDVCAYAAEIGDERRVLMFSGTCADVSGESLICGFVELDSLQVTFLKSYPHSDEGNLAWIYRGRLFPFGIGGRWSRTGLPTNWSGPFLLVPGVEAARTFMALV